MIDYNYVGGKLAESKLKCKCGKLIGTIKQTGEKNGLKTFEIKSNGNECKKIPLSKHFLHCPECCKAK